jgi:hypothetical protein
MWVLLDDEGEVVRYFDYAHEGAVEVVEPKHTYDELLNAVGECLL